MSDLFRLSNGHYVLDETISDKLRIIKDAEPERRGDGDTGYSWDECGMAELFSECYISDTRFCPEVKSWMTYADGAWRKDVGSLLVAEKIKEFVRIMILYCGEIQDEEIRTGYFKFVSKMGDRRLRDRIMKDAASVFPIAAKSFDANPNLINCKNGTYDLTTMSFREPSWEDYLTMQTNFEYYLEPEENNRWHSFVKEVCSGDEEKVKYLQKALGYSMLGLANEECMFILHGKTTRNGKSTLLSAIHHLLGDYASVSPVSIICKSDKSRNAEAASPMLASLKGKRFVTMAESNQYGRLDEEVLKQLTGGEEMKARNLYESAFSFLPQFTLWLSCNDLPAVQDKSLFASDRVRVIEFNRHFEPHEQDKNLKSIFQEPRMMSNIFMWLIGGYFMYKREGLVMAEDMKRVVREYEHDNDVVLQFLEQQCKAVSDGQTKAKTLYDAYKLWAKNNGFYVFSSKKFNSQLTMHTSWYEDKTTSGGYPYYRGLILKG